MKRQQRSVHNNNIHPTSTSIPTLRTSSRRLRLVGMTTMTMTTTMTTAVVAVVAAVAATVVDGVEMTQPHHHHLRTTKTRHRALVSAAYCGSNWQDAHDTCNTSCESDEDCGPGRYCFTYMECTPSTSNSTSSSTTTTTSANSTTSNTETIAEDDLDMQLMSASSSSSSSSLTPAPAPTTTTNSVPSYIASLPVAPSLPTTAAPFVMTPPTPNTLPNPNSNFCGYDWESANSECYHACPSGMDTECPNGRKCHTWLKCTPAPVDPAVYSVCGLSWEHAASTCATRCFQGNDDTCPPGESCFRGVVECDEKLPTLTAVDAGLAEKTYTQEEIATMLDEEIAKARDEEAMSDPNNWWCGSSYSNMLETCSKRCTTDEDCKPSAWEEGSCFKTTGGPENCSTPGVPVKEPVPEGSRWCGSTWNDMLETCSAMCEADEDCLDGKTCWEAPGTCQYIGVPAKEKSDPATLWCGVDFDDAMTSCHKACPGETNEECPAGMSCFSGSSCTTEGEPVVREGYRCGTTWDDASAKCGLECQSVSDCNEDEGEECFADVVCESELKANMTEGMFCGDTWESTSLSCTQSCEEDDDCAENQWCYWVECENGIPDDENATMTMMMMEPTTEAAPVSCDAEVKECPSGVFVAKAPELGCDFYPCPEEGDVVESEASSIDSVLSGWGSTPLSHSCTSDGSGSCGLCQGDCGSDEDCQEGLLCFSRGEGEVTSVPGCTSGGEGDLPGMDYCYSPFPPATTTTTAATTTTTTIMETMSTTTGADATTTTSTDEAYTMGNLEFARECTESDPCGVCEGDCDNDMQCGDGLKCFSRVKGSVDLVPGCLGLGIDGMDYCYDPNAPAETPPTSSMEDQEASEGCSAEVRSCPGGSVVRQDPNNNCEFEPCPEDEMTANIASTPDSDTAMPSEAKLDTSAPTYMASMTEQPTMSPITSPPTTMPSVEASSMSSGVESCDELCLEVLPSDFCPPETELPNCLEVNLGELCEASGECGTDDKLNNCGTFDIYVRVVCGYATPSQGQLMKEQGEILAAATAESDVDSSATPLPTLPPVEASSTITPTSPIPVLNASNFSSTEISVATTAAVATTTTSTSTSSSSSLVENSPVVIVDAIAANATNSSSTTTTANQVPTYENTTTATTTDGGFQYDRNSGAGGGVDNAAVAPHEANEPVAKVWYTASEEEEEESSEEVWPPAETYEGGDLTAYFQSSAANSLIPFRSIFTSIIKVMGIIIPVILAYQ